MRRLLLGTLLLVGSGGAVPAQEVPLQLELRDGTRIPLQDWTLSYEYALWNEGTPASLAQSRSHQSRMLIEDKDEIPLGGSVLEFQFTSRSSSRFVDGEMQRVEIEQPSGFTLVTGEDKRRKFEHPDPPHRDRVAPEADAQLFQPRGLDLRGATLTGTRRSFCLFSYTALVECSDDPAQQVVRIEFP